MMLKKLFRKSLQLCNSFTGINLVTCLNIIYNIPLFIYDSFLYTKKNKSQSFKICLSKLYPILTDRNTQAGNTQSHYFHQDIWAAKKLLKKKPTRHVDIGSRIDGFVSHCLVFRKMEVIDIRNLSSTINNLSYIKEDATTLKSFKNNELESISTLHAAEHFGLGRYSDPIDPDAFKIFFENLQRVLKENGTLYFSVPIGKERLEFNAQRVFSPKTILSLFCDLKLVSFSVIDDHNNFYEDVNPKNYESLHYGCGLFEFKK